MNNRGWLVPLTGIAFLAFLIAAFAVGGEPPSADEPVQEVVDHYVDNKDSIVVACFLMGFALLLLVFFANHVRHLMREAPTSPLILVGASIVAVGGAIDATILLALAEAAEDIDPTAVQALQALWDNDFLPMAVGVVVFLVASGISILRTGVLPRWVGYVALGLAVIGVTPLGFAAFPGAGLWVILASVMLAVRARRTAAPAIGPPD